MKNGQNKVKKFYCGILHNKICFISCNLELTEYNIFYANFLVGTYLNIKITRVIDVVCNVLEWWRAGTRIIMLAVMLWVSLDGSCTQFAIQTPS